MSTKTSQRRVTADRRARIARTLRNPNADAKALDLLTLVTVR